MGNIGSCMWFNLMESTDNLFTTMSILGMDLAKHPQLVLDYCDFLIVQTISSDVFIQGYIIFNDPNNAMAQVFNTDPTFYDPTSKQTITNYVYLDYTGAVYSDIATALKTEHHFGSIRTIDDFNKSILDNSLLVISFLPWDTTVIKNSNTGFSINGQHGDYIAKVKDDGTEIKFNPLKKFTITDENKNSIFTWRIISYCTIDIQIII